MLKIMEYSQHGIHRNSSMERCMARVLDGHRHVHVHIVYGILFGSLALFTTTPVAVLHAQLRSVRFYVIMDGERCSDAGAFIWTDDL